MKQGEVQDIVVVGFGNRPPLLALDACVGASDPEADPSIRRTEADTYVRRTYADVVANGESNDSVEARGASTKQPRRDHPKAHFLDETVKE